MSNYKADHTLMRRPIRESEASDRAETWRWRDWVTASCLFFATAGVVVWQNRRLGILWDLSYILENAYRISLGDVPYRDFPLAHAPLTFLGQALLIKLTGRVFFHHVLYCATVGGLATVLTWRILCHLLHGAVGSAWFVAFLLSAPLTILGIYCIFPHPFYDPDCTFAILLCVVFLQRLDRGSSWLRTFLTGALLVIPSFVKQNTGLVFLSSTLLITVALFALDSWRGRAVSCYRWLMAGTGAGLGCALLVIHYTAGAANYAHWTVRYAIHRRMPPLTQVFALYRDPLLPWWGTSFLAGVLFLGLNRRGRRAMALLSLALMALPFVGVFVYQFVGDDASDRADALLSLWPLVLALSLGFTLSRVVQWNGFTLALPFLIIATVHGAFLSQQLWGSTYALWPLCMILLATILSSIAALSAERAWVVLPLTMIIAASMLVGGVFYVVSQERLDYAKLSGKVLHSTLPPLSGLSIAGPWIPEFEELVRFTEQEINKQEVLLMIPGEDLFYYATGRRPRFPVVVFDYTVNPYTAEEILELSRSRKVGWLIVKRIVQLDPDPVENRDRLLTLLRQDFVLVRSLGNYDLYRPKAISP